LNIAIFASGRGSNFSAIARAVKKGSWGVKISLLVCDNPRALVIKKAQANKVKALIALREDFKSRDDFERVIIQRLKADKINLIVLAGFMRMLSPGFVKKFRNRIINIHPALLPAFKGSTAIKDAFNYGVKFTGVTVHFVDELMDHGAIILQEPVSIEKKDTLAGLENKIHRLEHRLYPEAIKLFAQGRLKIIGRSVTLTP